MARTPAMASVSPAGADGPTASTTSTATPTPITTSSPVPSFASSPASAPAPSPVASSPSSASASPISSFATAAAKSSALPASSLQRSEPQKSLRGLNKPKCIKCGNVARSRCPYQSCKSCCAKAQNPCHIHVLKPNSTLADRSPSTNFSHSEQQPNEASFSGSSSRPASIRQLSSTFAQFNNVHIPLRSRKPLTRKDAITVNEWRFSKLKEFRNANIEAENEAFDRYMQNVSLLEEVFDANTAGTEDSFPVSNPPANKPGLVSDTMVKSRSDPVRIHNFRKRIQNVVEQGLRKLQKRNQKDPPNDPTIGAEHDLSPKKAKISDDGKAWVMSELNDKINKARSKDDLSMCLQMVSQLGNAEKVVSEMETAGDEIPEFQKTEHGSPVLEYSLLKPVKTNVIGQDDLSRIDIGFSLLEEIQGL